MTSSAAHARVVVAGGRVVRRLSLNAFEQWQEEVIVCVDQSFVYMPPFRYINDPKRVRCQFRAAGPYGACGEGEVSFYHISGSGWS